MKDVFVFILAGGRGKRLYPLTKDRAKPMVPFGGIYRAVDFTISNSINSDFHKIILLTQYESDSLYRYIRRGWGLPSPKFNEIYICPPQHTAGLNLYKGTADAVYQNISFLKEEHPDYIIILASDHIYKMDYSKMLDFHIHKNADVTVGAVEVDLRGASSYGIIVVDSVDRIIGFEEKPESPKHIPGKLDKAYASMGIYVFSGEALIEALTEDVADRYSSHDFGGDIIPKMFREKLLYAYNFWDDKREKAEYWRDVGTIDSYFEANMDLVENGSVLDLYDPGWPVYTCIGERTHSVSFFTEKYKGWGMGVAIDSVISPGCIIGGGRVESSVLSPKVYVGSWANVYESVLFEGVKVGKGARIKRAIIDEGVEIPDEMEIGFNLHEDMERFTVSPKGVVVIPKGYVFSHISKPLTPAFYPTDILEGAKTSIEAEQPVLVG